MMLSELMWLKGLMSEGFMNEEGCKLVQVEVVNVSDGGVFHNVEGCRVIQVTAVDQQNRCLEGGHVKCLFCPIVCMLLCHVCQNKCNNKMYKM